MNRLNLIGCNREGWMAVCPPEEKWLRAGTNHPALLAWYLSDEPEGHGHTPASLRDKYLQLKATDPNHPIALDHFMWEALVNYKDACDFTMTSVYPLTAASPAPITHVGLFIDHARSLHRPNWPHWPFIQIFGGPDCEGGKWKQPTRRKCAAWSISRWRTAPTVSSISPIGRRRRRPGPPSACLTANSAEWHPGSWRRAASWKSSPAYRRCRSGPGA